MEFEIVNIMGEQCRVKKTTIRYKKRKGFCRNVLAEDVPVNINPGVNSFVNNDSILRLS